MTIEQCQKRNEKVMQAWEEWKNGENYLDNLDCAIVCEMLDIKYPMACQKHLISTDSPNDARTTAPNRKTLETIFNFLDTLKNARRKLI